MEATTTSILHTIGVVQSIYPEWSVPPMLFEILATMVLGVVGIWTREIFRHYDDTNDSETSILKCLTMIVPGIFAGLLGGEVAQMFGYSPTDLRDPSWLFVLVIGYTGPAAMEMISKAVLGIMQKGLERWGLDFEKQQVDNMKRIDEDEKRRTDMRRQIEDKQFESELEKFESVPEQP